ncbi:MAG: S-adenosylmethionine:tRNA ribosyltransferase-isomerase, partial [Coriobacteriia bacterium]|nr:S-adenosylmethionine:tRNA ribosyltransferase-isomerase [Coriobacteriia bacterium]
MKTEDFNYDLPEDCIAQAPAEPRDSCKLLVLNRKTQSMEHKRFFEIANYLEPGDLLVVNNTRVLPARLRGFKEHSGGAAELLLLTKREDIDPLGYVWECLVKPGRRLK